MRDKAAFPFGAERQIYAGPERIFPLVGSLNSWPVWMPWRDKTREWHTAGEGPDASANWTDTKGRPGRMRVVAFEDGRRIQLEVGFGAASKPCFIDMEIVVERSGKGSLVRWHCRPARPSFFVNLMFRIFWRLIRKNYVLGLDQLAKAVE